MGIYRYAPEAGWDGIVEALARTQAGDDLVIEAGGYQGESTLRIPSGVKLRGKEGAVFEVSGQRAALVIEDAEGVEISGIEIRCTASASEVGPPPEGGFLSDGGLIEVVTSRDIEVRCCICNGNAGLLDGLRIRRSHGIRVLSCTLSKGIFGIIAFSSTGSCFRDNHCWGNKRSGIVLRRDEHSKDRPSAAEIIIERAADRNCRYTWRQRSFCWRSGVCSDSGWTLMWWTDLPQCIPHFKTRMHRPYCGTQAIRSDRSLEYSQRSGTRSWMRLPNRSPVDSGRIRRDAAMMRPVYIARFWPRRSCAAEVRKRVGPLSSSSWCRDNPTIPIEAQSQASEATTRQICDWCTQS